MVIHNKTIFTGQEVYESLVRTSKKTYLSKWIFTGIMILIGLIIVLLAMTSKNYADSLVIGFMFLTIALVYGLMTLLSFVRLSTKIKKQNADILASGMENHFIFKEESFQLTTKAGSRTEKYEYPYVNLKKIVEEEYQILFYLSANLIFFCKKEGFASPKEQEVFFYGLSKHHIKIKKKLPKENQK